VSVLSERRRITSPHRKRRQIYSAHFIEAPDKLPFYLSESLQSDSIVLGNQGRELIQLERIEQ
jgi:hypothetical protein